MQTLSLSSRAKQWLNMAPLSQSILISIAAAQLPGCTRERRRRAHAWGRAGDPTHHIAAEGVESSAGKETQCHSERSQARLSGFASTKQLRLSSKSPSHQWRVVSAGKPCMAQPRRPVCTPPDSLVALRVGQTAGIEVCEHRAAAVHEASIGGSPMASLLLHGGSRRKNRSTQTRSVHLHRQGSPADVSSSDRAPPGPPDEGEEEEAPKFKPPTPAIWPAPNRVTRGPDPLLPGLLGDGVGALGVLPAGASRPQGR